MKKVFLLFAAMIAFMSAQAWTVKFTNPDGWQTVNAYTFVQESTEEIFALGAWPGTAMTKDGDVWTVEGTGEATHIIFNTTGAQTGNLDFKADATYNNLGVVGAEIKEFSIYFDNAETQWEEVYVYGWNGVGTAGWPGDKMTEVNDKGYYTFTFKGTSAPTGGSIIFNNGNGIQSGEFKWKTDAVYDMSGIQGEKPVIEAPAELYIVGTIKDNLWNPANTPMMEKDGNVFTIKGVEMIDDQSYTGFRFMSKRDWNAPQYGALIANALVTDGEPMTFKVQTTDSNWTLPENGVYDFVVDFDNNTMTCTRQTQTTIADSIMAEDGEAVYFNLQGMRVDNPASGLYIVIKNGKSCKVLIEK